MFHQITEIVLEGTAVQAEVHPFAVTDICTEAGSRRPVAGDLNRVTEGMLSTSGEESTMYGTSSVPIPT